MTSKRANATANIMRDARHRSVEDLYSVVSFWVFIWGLGLGAGSLVETALSDASYGWRISLAGIALFAVAFVTMALLDKSRAARDAVKAYRHVYMLMAAGLIGYVWHGYSHAQSDEVWTGKAAIWACAKLPECRQSAERYGDLNGKITIIPPAEAVNRQ